MLLSVVRGLLLVLVLGTSALIGRYAPRRITVTPTVRRVDVMAFSAKSVVCWEREHEICESIVFRERTRDREGSACKNTVVLTVFRARVYAAVTFQLSFGG